MSGGGGGGGPGGGFEPNAVQTPCGELRFRTSVSSPQPAASTLAVGDILGVVLETEPRPVVRLVDSASKVVGSVVGHLPDLLRCIQEGLSYEAEVLEINGGQIKVQIRPA